MFLFLTPNCKPKKKRRMHHEKTKRIGVDRICFLHHNLL